MAYFSYTCGVLQMAYFFYTWGVLQIAIFRGEALSRNYLLHSLIHSQKVWNSSYYILIYILIFIPSKNLKMLRPFYLVSKFFCGKPRNMFFRAANKNCWGPSQNEKWPINSRNKNFWEHLLTHYNLMVWNNLINISIMIIN